ncbi:unnamed protein product, partial [Prorocentrum cordatum]
RSFRCDCRTDHYNCSKLLRVFCRRGAVLERLSNALRRPLQQAEGGAVMVVGGVVRSWWAPPSTLAAWDCLQHALRPAASMGRPSWTASEPSLLSARHASCWPPPPLPLGPANERPEEALHSFASAAEL